MEAQGSWRRLLLVLLTVSALPSVIGCGSSLGGSATQPQAKNPTLLVADSSNNRVLIFDGPFRIGQSASVVLGQVDFTTMSVATTANGLNDPVNAIPDANGNIWVTDWGNNRVLEYTPPFASGMAASVVLGQMNFTTSARATTPSGFSLPQGLAFDKSGNLWVADSYNNRVVEFTPPFSDGMASSLVLGQTDLNFNCIATVSRLCFPTNLAFDANGDLWVVDTDNNRAVEYKPPFVTGEIASIALGQADFTSKGAATGQRGLEEPWGVAFDDVGNLWLADGANWRVLEFSPPFATGQTASVVLGFQDFTSTVNSNLQSSMTNPRGVAFDSAGNLFVADTGGSRVMVFSPPFTDGMNATIVVGQPSFNTVGGTVSPTSSGMSNPVGISIKY